MRHRETPAAPLLMRPDASVRHQVLHKESTGTSIKISNLPVMRAPEFLEPQRVCRGVFPGHNARVPGSREARGA